MKALLNYTWPGNIRELEHVMERAHIISQGKFIDTVDLPAKISGLRPDMPDDNIVSVNR